MKQLERMRIPLICVVGFWLLFSCIPASLGFASLKHQFESEDRVLIKQVHDDSWTIGYRYSGDCPAKDRADDKEWEAAITDLLREWLQPLREMRTKRPIVDTFHYSRQPDIKKIDWDKRDNLDKAERDNFQNHLLRSEGLDLRVTLQCEGSSRIYLSRLPPDVYYGSVEIRPFMPGLSHELGHAIGTGDTYIGRIGKTPAISKGGIPATMGYQPTSVMSGHLRSFMRSIPVPDAPTNITADDINSIVWLYKHFHEGLDIDDCFFSDYEFEVSPAGCVPKHPLIFEIKHGRDRTAQFLMSEDENLDVNAQDKTGSTALFWAAKLGSYGIVELLFDHRNPDVNIPDNTGATPLDVALKQGHQSIANLLLKHDSAWTEVEATAPAHHRSVFYFRLDADPSQVFHAGYLGTVLGGDALFVVQKSKDDSIERSLGKADVSLFSYKGLVAADIKIRELGVFLGANGETGSVLLAVRDVALGGYTPLALSGYPVVTETALEVLRYASKDGGFELRMRSCFSVPDAGLGEKGYGQHTCVSTQDANRGLLLFDKEERTLVGFVSDVSDRMPLADVVSTALIQLVDRKPVAAKNKLATTWGAIKSR